MHIIRPTPTSWRVVEMEEREELVDLTWYNLKKVSSWFVWIGSELVDLASLQRYTALKQRERY